MAAMMVACEKNPVNTQKPEDDTTETPVEKPEPEKPVVEDEPAVFVATRMGSWHKMDEIALIGGGQKMYSGVNSTGSTSKASFSMEGLNIKDGRVQELQDGSLAIIFDCGKGDFFYEVNNNLDAEMTRRGIKHTYDGSRSGGHNWDYWATSIITQVNFFMQYFNK